MTTVSTKSASSGGPLPVAIYTPASELRSPLALLAEMWHDLVASRELAWRLMLRDLSAQYRQSFLGVVWAFLPPIALAAGFTLAGDAKVINVAATELPYPAYVMLSMMLWQTFVESLNGPVQAVANAKQMLTRINFPREAIVLAKLGEVFFNFAVKLVLIVAVFVWYDVPVTRAAFLAPAALVTLIVLGTFLGLLLAPVGALYQDVANGLTVFTSLWLFLTPVVYPVPAVGTFAAIVKANPVTPLLVTTRELATTGVVSDPYRFLAVSAAALVGLLVTWVIFRLAMPFVIERVSS
ncbi:MAG: ABC transporter permease [Rubrivivax sp.]|nr:ABC transporter permease [Pyrinomonadaceae bacterium]